MLPPPKYVLVRSSFMRYMKGCWSAHVAFADLAVPNYSASHPWPAKLSGGVLRCSPLFYCVEYIVVLLAFDYKEPWYKK